MKLDIESKTYRVWQLLDLIADGELILPSVQRGVDWTDKDTLDFLASIFKEYPLGSQFYFWIPSDDAIDTVYTYARSIQDTALDVEHREEMKFIIDGQQRITSIRKVLCGDLDIGFDPVSKTFKKLYEGDYKKNKVWLKEKTDYIDSAGNLIPLTPDSKNISFIPLSLIRTLSVNEVFDKTPNAFNKKGNTNELNDEIFNTVKSFLRIFQNLEFDAKILKNHPYSEVSEIFVNLNRKGKRVSTLDAMVTPIILEKMPNFKQETTKTLQIVSEKFPGFANLIDYKFIVLNTIYCLQGYAGTAHGIKDKDIKKADVAKALKTSTQGTLMVLEKLVNLGITTSSMISANYPIHVMAVTYGRFLSQRPDIYTNPTATQQNSIMLYFLLSSLSSRYSSNGNNQMRKNDMDIAFGKFGGRSTDPFLNLGNAVMGYKNKGLSEDRWVVPEDLASINLTKGGNFYFTLLGLSLKERGAPSFADGNTGIDFQDSHKHHIFPKAKLKEREEFVPLMNSIGNITFVHGDPNKFEFSDKLPSEYLKKLKCFNGSSQDEIKKSLGKHFIPADESLWEFDNFIHFLSTRTNSMAQHLNAFVEKYVNK